MATSTINGPFSIAMLVYQSVALMSHEKYPAVPIPLYSYYELPHVAINFVV